MRHARTSVSSHDAHRWTTATGEAETREKRARAFPTRLPREKVYSGFLARSACWSTPLVSARPTTRVADMADDLRREPLRASNESFGIEALVGNGNDNVFVKGDPRVRRREPSRGVELHSARATNASSDAILPPPPPQASAPVGSPSASRETASVIRRSVDWNAESRDTAGLTMDERAFLAELASRRALVTDRARTTEVREALAAGARPMPVARPSTALPRRPSASESSENVPLDPSSADVALRPAPGGASPAKRGARPRTAVPSSRSRASIASSLSAYARRRSVTFASPRDEHDDAVRLSAESIAAGAGVTSSPSSAQLRGSRTRSVGPGTSASADAQTSTNRRLRFSSPGGGGGVGLAAEPPTDGLARVPPRRLRRRTGRGREPGRDDEREKPSATRRTPRDTPQIGRRVRDARLHECGRGGVPRRARRGATHDHGQSQIRGEDERGNVRVRVGPDRRAARRRKAAESREGGERFFTVAFAKSSNRRRRPRRVATGAVAVAIARTTGDGGGADVARTRGKHVETSPPGRASGIGGGRRRRQRPREGEGEVARRADVDRRRAATRVRVEPEPVGNGGSFAGARAADARASWAGSFGRGVSVEGVVAGARLRASASAARAAETEWEWQGRWQWEWQQELERGARRGDEETRARPSPTRRASSPSPTRRASSPSPTRRASSPSPTRRASSPSSTSSSSTSASSSPEPNIPDLDDGDIALDELELDELELDELELSASSPPETKARSRRAPGEEDESVPASEDEAMPASEEEAVPASSSPTASSSEPVAEGSTIAPARSPAPAPEHAPARTPVSDWMSSTTVSPVSGVRHGRRSGAPPPPRSGPAHGRRAGSATPAPVSPPPRTEGMSYRERRDVWKEAKAASTGREGEDA